MMATVDKIEEEDGVITVYFSSPYEVSTPYQVPHISATDIFGIQKGGTNSMDVVGC